MEHGAADDLDISIDFEIQTPVLPKTLSNVSRRCKGWPRKTT